MNIEIAKDIFVEGKEYPKYALDSFLKRYEKAIGEVPTYKWCSPVFSSKWFVVKYILKTNQKALCICIGKGHYEDMDAYEDVEIIPVSYDKFEIRLFEILKDLYKNSYLFDEITDEVVKLPNNN